MNTKLTPVEKATLFCKLSKSYLSYTVAYGIVDKVWNNGNGALDLYRFGKDNKVTVNTLLETKSDRTKLMKFMPNAKVIEKELDYPDFYFKSLPDPDKKD